MKLKSERSGLAGEILIPASKSHTIRAVSFSGMAEGKSVLRNPLIASDTISCINSIKEFGAVIEQDKDLVITGTRGLINPECKKIDVGNSGTTLRILTALAALAPHPITFDGDESIRKRPMIHLLSALENLGAEIDSTDNKCPFVIKGPLKGGKTVVNGISSQFVTALLIACPLAKHDTEIYVENLHEKPYLEMTIDWLKKQSIEFENKGLDWFKITGGQKYKAFDLPIPADFSSATFSLCAAAITGSEILIKGLDFTDHQGDKEVFKHIEKMGAQIKHTSDGVLVRGDNLKGIEIDMNATPDALPALAVAGCFAEGKTSLLNVAQARLKECDRISCMATELRKMKAEVEELEDGLIIKKSELAGTNVCGYNDHRMVMALTIAGIASKGETFVDSAESVNITYPSFVKDMQNLGAKIELID
ncbi:MAG: 3-phosphoshikimate 1-carboxyvinyltransferase [Bacteroidales bacterium]|nr:MAG: 3-phosphoshikimate 1-carboxyvinyltransferase [Bacteroidales bacterium]